jgi:RNA polymerase subunit RPABC4/transcription elongation factor Spt4
MQITLPENLATIIQVVLFVLGAYLLAVYVGMLVWTWRDIRARSNDLLAAFLSVLVVLVFNLMGLVLYLILRPREKLADVYERELAEEALLQDIEDRYVCPECNRRVEADYLLCPACQVRLRKRCVGCDRLMNLQWIVCPYCGEWEEEPETSVDTESVEVEPWEPAGSDRELPLEEVSPEPERLGVSEGELEDTGPAGPYHTLVRDPQGRLVVEETTGASDLSNESDEETGSVLTSDQSDASQGGQGAL